MSPSRINLLEHAPDNSLARMAAERPVSRTILLIFFVQKKNQQYSTWINLVNENCCNAFFKLW